MKRLLTFCLSLIVTFSLIAVASISIGRGRPASKAVQYWHLTDCAPPCWADITPNSTSVNEAINQLERLFSSYERVSGGGNFWSWGKGNVIKEEEILINLIPSKDKEAVSGVYVKAPTLPDIGELIVVLGPPACVMVDDSTRYVRLIYVNGENQLVGEFGAVSLSVATSANYIRIEATDFSCPRFMTVPWRGFRSYELYLADVANRK